MASNLWRPAPWYGWVLEAGDDVDILLLAHRHYSFMLYCFFETLVIQVMAITYIVSENKGKWSNSQTGWRYELLKKKFLPNSKFSHPKPLCTKVKKCKRWLFNDFLWFPTTHTTIVLWYMIVEPIWVTEQPLKSIILRALGETSGILYLYFRSSNLHSCARDMHLYHLYHFSKHLYQKYVDLSYLHRCCIWKYAVLDRAP